MRVARAALYGVSLAFSAIVLAGLLDGDELNSGVRTALAAMVALSVIAPRIGLVVFAGLGPIVGGITLLLGKHLTDIQVLEGSALAIVGGWAIRGLLELRRPRASAWSPVALAILAWLLYMLCTGVAYGWAHGFTVEYFTADFIIGLRLGDTTRTALTMTIGPWLALAAVDLLRDAADRERTAWAFVLGISGAAALNINRLVEAALRSDTPWARFVELVQTQRVNTLFTDLNAAGSWFVMAAVIAAGLSLANIHRLSSAGASLMSLAGAVLSGSRAALMAFGAVSVAWLVARLPRRFRLVAVVVGLVMLFGLLQFSTARRKLTDTDEQLSVQFRTMMLSAGWRMFQDHPIIGVGPGRFFAFSGSYMDPELRARMYPYENAHNNFLQLLAETGIAGGVILLSLLVTMAWSVWYARGPDRVRWPLSGGLAAFLLTCLLGHPLLVPQVAMCFWLVTGVLGAAVSTESSRPSVSATQ